jgi:hypothetical protein
MCFRNDGLLNRLRGVIRISEARTLHEHRCENLSSTTSSEHAGRFSKMRATSSVASQVRLSSAELVSWDVPYLRRLVAGFPPWPPGFDTRSCHVGFVVDKVALRQVFSDYFSFPCQFSYHLMPYTHPASGAGTMCQTVSDTPSGLSLTSPQEIQKITN